MKTELLRSNQLTANRPSPKGYGGQASRKERKKGKRISRIWSLCSLRSFAVPKFCCRAVLGIFLSLSVANAEEYGPEDLEKLGMSVISQGVTWNMFTFTETLDVLNELGIEGIEAYRGQQVGGGFDEPSNFNTVSREAKDYMKRIAADKGVEIRHYGVASAKSPEQWRQFFEFAKEMGLKAIISEPEYDELEIVDALAQEFDIRVGIHNHPIPTKYWHPDIVLHHLKGLSDHVGISMDTGNWARSGLDPLECMKKFRELEGRIVEVQLKDMAGGKFVPLGTGDSNVAGMLRELHRQNFRGTLTIEYFGKMTVEEKIREIRESLDYLYRVAYWINKR